MRRKILFLDIDGVLAGEKWFLERRNGGDFIDPNKVELLNSLDCEIVISSSWGHDNGRTEHTLKEKGLKLPIVGYTEHYEIGRDWIVRGNSILKWLIDNMKDTDYQYAILDDNNDMLISQSEHLVHTNAVEGVTEHDIEKVKEILSSEIL